MSVLSTETATMVIAAHLRHSTLDRPSRMRRLRRVIAGPVCGFAAGIALVAFFILWNLP